MLHADARGPIAAHGVADQPAALPAGDRPIVPVDVRHDVARDVVFEIAGGHRAGVHRAVVHGLRVRQDDDHLVRALGKRPLDRLRHVDLLRPLLRTNRVAMQRVDDGIAARAVLVVARRQKHDRIAIDGVSFEIAFQRLAVNGDALDDRGPCPRDDVGHVGLDLRDSRKRSRGRGESRGQNGRAS